MYSHVHVMLRLITTFMPQMNIVFVIRIMFKSKYLHNISTHTYVYLCYLLTHISIIFQDVYATNFGMFPEIVVIVVN